MTFMAIVAFFGAFVYTLFVLYANSMRSSPGPFVGKWLIMAIWIVVVILFISAATASGTPSIMRKEERSALGAFGTYSTNYLQRRWARMCKGPERYDAMREAFNHGYLNPCAR